MTIDEISPGYIGEDKLQLSLDPTQVHIRTLQSVLVNVDYSQTMPEGVVLPLIFESQGPSPFSYTRKVFYRQPTSFVWVPQEGGRHMLLLREAAHNRWHGKLKLRVEGETNEVPRPQ